MKKCYAKKRIQPLPMTKDMTVPELIDKYFLAYNGARLQEVCHLLEQRVLKDNVTVGLSLSGALTPAGFGMSFIIPLIKHGFVDYIVSTGANIYHDIHFGLGFGLYQSSPFVSDVHLREDNVVRIYDIVFDQQVLFDTDKYVYDVIMQKEFQRTMGSGELHYLLGKAVDAKERELGLKEQSFLAEAYRSEVPVYCSAPGDGTVGLNVAARSLRGDKLTIDVNADVNETTAIVYGIKKSGGKSAVIILGGGSPKNFLLQTEPQIQEILGLYERGHDYFIQITDARPDTGGLSGATPSEAVSWGKVDPDVLGDTVVCYSDTTIAFPLMVQYMLSRCEPREQKRLYHKTKGLVEALKKDYLDRLKKTGASI